MTADQLIGLLERVRSTGTGRWTAGWLVDLAKSSSAEAAPTLATVQAAITREAEDLREALAERASILEVDAGLPRPQAELEAARIVTALARARGCLWSSLS